MQMVTVLVEIVRTTQFVKQIKHCDLDNLHTFGEDFAKTTCRGETTLGTRIGVLFRVTIPI